jgi:outer membrane receptor protein involved in Fe transport
MKHRRTLEWICCSCFLVFPLAGASLEGIIVDVTGHAIPNVRGDLRTALNQPLATAVSDRDGRIQWEGVTPGAYVISIFLPQFERHEEPILVRAKGSTSLRIALRPAPVRSEVTVSASRGNVESLTEAAYLAVTKDRDTLFRKHLSTIGNALQGEPNILVQQTTSAQVSPFLRGFTGYHVLNLIDGIRFNNSTFRSGPNQYLAFVDPRQVDRVEALLGPAAVQYGSDSLGGTINVLTADPAFGESNTWTTHADGSGFGNTGDNSLGGGVSLSLGTERTAILFGGSYRTHGDIRPGGGFDSRNVYRRLFDLSPSQTRLLIGEEQQGTEFSQHAAHAKLIFRPKPDQLLSVLWQHAAQKGVQGYKDLLGGLGRLQSLFDPQSLQFAYVRYQKFNVARLDSLAATFSINSQTDGSRRQNLLASDPITTDLNRVDSFGYSVQGARQWGTRGASLFGADLYHDRVASQRFLQRAASNSSIQRPLYPDGSTYRLGGIFGQQSVHLFSGRMRLGGGGRLTTVRFSIPENTLFRIPPTTLSFYDSTFSSSASWRLTDSVGVHAQLSRGFRAPNLNDAGALGLNDLGYEVPASEAQAAGALLSTDSGESAVSKGTTLRELRPESLMSYEIGFRITTRRLYARVQAFDAELRDPVVRRTLLFVAANVPASLAGLPVTAIAPTPAQAASGVVAVATAFDPRAVKAFVNDGRARYYGAESLLRISITDRLSTRANYSFLVGRELDPDRNARRLSPQMGSLSVRNTMLRRRMWVEASAHAAGPQNRLSGGDIDDERIGGSRRRRDIADFFRGDRVQAHVDFETGVFRPTGETVRGIQDRVLPLGATINGVRIAGDDTRVPLYASTAGWLITSVAAGVQIGEGSELVIACENLTDRNYRVHGSGIDQLGRSMYVGFRWSR